MISVLGDILIEDQKVKEKSKYHISALGGAGNLAINLALADPNNHVKLFWPRPMFGISQSEAILIADRLPPNLEICYIRTDTVSYATDLRWYGTRNRDENCEKIDPNVNWELLTEEILSNPMARKSLENLKSSLLLTDLVAIEWHYDNPLSCMSLYKSFLTKYHGWLYVDARHPKSVDVGRMIDFWKMNDQEYELYLKVEDPASMAFLVRTFGARGAAILGGNKKTVFNIQEASDHERVNEIGCGDTFGAHFLASFLRHKADMKTALSIGIQAGGIAVSNKHVVGVSEHDIVRDLICGGNIN